MAVAETVRAWFDKHDLGYHLIPHPVTFDSRASAEAAHISRDHTAKAVLLKDEQGYLMVIISANQWIKLHAIQQSLNRKLELAAESEIEQLFKDCLPGAIPPLGQAYGIETVVDLSLTSLASVYLEAGDHENLLQISGEYFHELMQGARQGHFGHPG